MRNLLHWFRDLLTLETGEMINTRRLIRFFFFLVCLFTLIFGITFIVLLRSADKVQLPNVNQMDIMDAMQKLQRLRLRVYVKQNYSREVPRFHIISQKPKPGTIVKKGRVIILKVSMGTKVKDMPDFTDEHFDVAQNELVSLFSAFEKAPNIVKILQFSTNIERHHIIDQSPKPGDTIDFNGDIVFIVSRGISSNSIVISDYRWKNYKNVARYLEDFGLDVKVRLKQTAAKSKIGKIFAQSVKPKTELNKGEGIEFIVGVEEGRDSSEDTEIWRVFSLLVPPRPADFKAPEGVRVPKSDKIRLVEIYVEDARGKDRRFSDRVTVGSYLDLPYRSYGKGFIEVRLDGEKYTTQVFP